MNRCQWCNEKNEKYVYTERNLPAERMMNIYLKCLCLNLFKRDYPGNVF